MPLSLSYVGFVWQKVKQSVKAPGALVICIHFSMPEHLSQYTSTYPPACACLGIYLYNQLSHGFVVH